LVAETPEKYGFDSVLRDIRGGVADVVRHYYAAGHRNIAMLAAPTTVGDFDREEKLAGYEDAVRELGLKAQIIRKNANSPEAIAKAVIDAKPRPTAVISIESQYGLALVQHGARLGLRIPEDVVVASFDDGDLGAFTQPRMASLHAFGEDLAELAVQRLVDKLDGHIEGRIKERLPCVFVDHTAIESAAESTRNLA
jgi:LacI family transcriptional regulator